MDANIYQMPEGDWAWADFGIIRDGFSSRESALANWTMERKLMVLADAYEDAD